MFNYRGSQKSHRLISVPLSVVAIIALVVQSIAWIPLSPAVATYGGSNCTDYNVYSMGYWKEHPAQQIFPQTLGNITINSSTEAEAVFNTYSESAFNKLKAQLLALKFSIVYSGAGNAIVPGDNITLNQLAGAGDALLILSNPGDSDLLSLAWKIEQVNTAQTVRYCPSLNATLIVKKHVVNDNGGTLQAPDFTMIVNTSTDQRTFGGSETGAILEVSPGNYSVDEQPNSNYTKSLSADCSGTIASGETKTCTVTNNDKATSVCRLEIQKTVSKEIATPGDTITYTINFKNTGNYRCTGGGVKVEDTVDPRLEYVSETHTSNVSAGYGSYPIYHSSTLRWNAHQLDPNETGQVTWTAVIKPITSCGIFDIPNTARISANELNWQWVLSNTTHTVGQIICPATLIVKKHVVNDNGGTLQAPDFTMIVNTSTDQRTFGGSETGAILEVSPGNYSVDEQPNSNYTKSLSADCSGTIASGETKTCTVTNNDNNSSLITVPVATCTGEGSLYLYQGDNPFQTINTSLVANQNQLVIFTRHSPTITAKVNGVPQAFSLIQTVSGSDVKIFVLDTAPGDTVEIAGSGTYGARDVQGYLMQDTTSPVYDLSTIQYIFDDAQANNMYLQPGSYSYVFFDKYTINRPGEPADTRNLTALVNQGASMIVNQSYNQPTPSGSQGAVVGNYNITIAGNYTLSVDTEDSVYWPLVQCPLPPPATLIVKKHVINDNGGNKIASDFSLDVALPGDDQTVAGNESGVSIIVPPGNYQVSEPINLGYSVSYSTDCTGVINAGETKTCTVTNNDPVPTFCRLEITKTVDKEIANPGDLLTYSLRVENTGTADCTGGGVKIQDTVDPRLTYLSEQHSPNTSAGYGSYPIFDGSMLRWNGHVLNPGEISEITWQATVNEIHDCGIFDIPNTARTTAQELSWQWVLSNTVHTVGSISCQAELIVKKIVLNDDGGTKVSADFTMSVIGTSPSPASFPGSATGTTVVIAPGQYSVSEVADPQYAMTLSTDCSGSISHGESKTCTVTNDDIPPEEAKLIVIKHVINNNNGIKVASDFEIEVNASGNFQQTITGNETGTELIVEPGSYRIIENDSFEYLVSYSSDCTGSIASGETKTCTVTNDDPIPPPPTPSYLIVIKHVTNDDGGSKTAADFTMNISAGNGTFTDSFPGQENPGVQRQVPIGDYNITETADPAYTMTLSGDCSGILAVGETKTCTITNDDIPPPPPPKGKLVIIKNVINDNGWTKLPADFSILVQAASSFQGIYAGQSSPGYMLDVDPGNYVIEEVDSLGYTKTKSTDCEGTIAAQEIKTCTITNDDPSTATLIIKKHVINNNGGSKVAADFSIDVDLPTTDQTVTGNESGVSLTVELGNYQVIEPNTLGYIVSYSSECNGSIAAGETKTCTVTNDDQGGGGCVGPSCGGGGCTGASCNPNPSPVNASISCGPNAVLSFTYGSDVNGISISNSLDFSGATQISPVSNINWAIPAGDGHTVYVKFQRTTGSIEIRQATTNSCTPPPEVLSCTNLVTAEAAEVNKTNQTLVKANKGKILVQSEAHGEIWYLYPATSLKYYIPGAPNTVSTIKLFADGITNENLSKIPVGLNQNFESLDSDNDGLKDLLELALGTSIDNADTDGDGYTDKVEVENGYNPLNKSDLAIDSDFAALQKGRFFLQVEGSGQIWYVNPVDGKRYFIPNDSIAAYNVVASLGEDISNGEIRQLPVGQEIKGVDISAYAGCYVPSPIVLGATELPRTGFPFDLAQLVVLPTLAAYPWLKKRYGSALASHFAKIDS